MREHPFLIAYVAGMILTTAYCGLAKGSGAVTIDEAGNETAAPRIQWIIALAAGLIWPIAWPVGLAFAIYSGALFGKKKRLRVDEDGLRYELIPDPPPEPPEPRGGKESKP